MCCPQLWRVNRVLQFSRRKVNMAHVLWPAWLIEAAAITLLSIWTAKSSYQWERVELDETGESMGSCVGENEFKLLVPIGILVMVPTILTGIMAYKTIDVDATYSEAKWIFSLMLVQCQVRVAITNVGLCTLAPHLQTILICFQTGHLSWCAHGVSSGRPVL